MAKDDAVWWAEPTSDGLVAGLDADEGARDGAAGLRKGGREGKR